VLRYAPPNAAAITTDADHDKAERANGIPGKLPAWRDSGQTVAPLPGADAMVEDQGPNGGYSWILSVLGCSFSRASVRYWPCCR